MRRHAHERWDLPRRPPRDLPPSCSQLRVLLRERWSQSSQQTSAAFGLISEGKALVKDSAGLRKHNPILRTLRPGQRRLDSREIKRQQFRIFGLGSLLVVKQSLLAGIGFDQRNLLGRCAQ